MDLTVHNTEELCLVQHRKDGSQSNYTTLVIKHKDGELRIDMFSKEPLTFTLGESDD
jgi:hypothetical protein